LVRRWLDARRLIDIGHRTSPAPREVDALSSSITTPTGDTCPADGLTIRQLVDILRERLGSTVFVASSHTPITLTHPPTSQQKPPNLTLKEVCSQLSFPSHGLPRIQVRVHEEGIKDALIHAKYLVNFFNVTFRIPPEILTMIPSYLTEDVFSASQVCLHWRSVLISFPSLWTGISCLHVRRTIPSLQRCDSLPIRLWLEPPLPTPALENVRLHEKKVISLTVTRNPDLIPRSHHLVMHFRSSMERLHIWSDEGGWRGVRGDRIYSEMWHDFSSLRELFISQYSISAESLSAPNLAHLPWNA